MITDYGSATPWAPSYNSVLPDSGWATVEGTEGANAANTARAQQAAAARAAAPAANPLTDANAFAQKLLDYNKQQKFAQGMMSMGGPFAQYGISQMFGPNKMQAPVASNPMEQLMVQALQQRAGGGGMAGNGRSMASYRR